VKRYYRYYISFSGKIGQNIILGDADYDLKKKIESRNEIKEICENIKERVKLTETPTIISLILLKKGWKW
jgi:hypothetical protein